MRQIVYQKWVQLLCCTLISILLCLNVQAQQQQKVRITGKVVSKEDGQPLIGATIAEKGTSNGTTTDANGNFRIDVRPTATIVVSFIGYIFQEEKIGNRSTITVTLQPDTQQLNDVVVVGYGIQKKESLTGAVSTITAKEIENRPVSNVALALQGLSPGLSITRQTGQPGSEGVDIQVRGASSANGNVAPLVVVDGVISPGVALETLNPNDIENISVLKDAAAAAIYGAQAAGGVILVTTKKGKEGKTVFEYSSIVGMDWAINIPKKLETWEELEYNNLARKNSGTAAGYTDEMIQTLKEGKIQYRILPTDTTQYQYFSTKSTIDQILRKSTINQTHNITARGGTAKLNFLVSMGLYDKQGIAKVGPDQNRRYNFRFNVGTQLTKHLSLDSRINYTITQQQAASQGTNGDGALLFNLYRNNNLTPLLTPEGRYTNAAGGIYAILNEGGYNNYNRNILDGVFTATVANFVKGLSIRAVYGAQFNRADRALFIRSVDTWFRTRISQTLNPTNGYTVTKDYSNSNNLQFLVDYDYSIGLKHKFHLLGGYQWQDQRSESISSGVSALVNNNLPALGLGDPTTKTSTQSVSTYAFQSYFGRFNYSYADKYLFEATFRFDESSRLAPGLRTKFFPSLSGGWNLHRESWFSLPAISQFKLRGSWGRLGAASGIGLYDYLALLTQRSNLVLGSPEVKTAYYSQSAVPSSQLSWETIETTNGGVDVGLFKNKLLLTFDYYVKYNNDMLAVIQLPSTFGITGPRVNNGKLKSWGWETEIKFRDRIGKNLNYSIALNVSDNQNRLIAFSGRRVVSSGLVSALEGYPLNTIWGYQTAGYFQTLDEVKAAAFQDSRTGAGDIKYVDLNGDNKITVGKGSIEDHGDLVNLGTTQPRYLFGANLSVQWKGFDFTAFFQGVGKRNFLTSSISLDPVLRAGYFPLAIHRDYWTPENPNAAWPRPYVNATHNFLPSDRWALDGQYMRLKNLQLGYSLPTSLLSKVKIARARIYFTGQDLLTFSKLGLFKGYFDSEQRNGVSVDYPYFATVAAGLNLTF
jgi:TonB-linked SusC/RagA family outer membrane protein